MLQHQSLKLIPMTADDESTEWIRKMEKIDDVYMAPGIVYNNGNVVLSTTGETQRIAWCVLFPPPNV